MPDEQKTEDRRQKTELSRRDALKKEQKLAEHEDLEMPLVEAELQYLLGYLFEIGPVLSGGMGNSPLTHEEIRAWQSNTGIELQAWEARFMKRLSNEYLSEAQRATAHDAAAPWADAPYVKPPPNLVALRMQQSLKELIKL